MKSTLKLTRELVSLIVAEAIRSSKTKEPLVHRGRVLGKKFHMNTFTGLTDLRTMHLYARRFLEVLGTGSSRITYLLSSGEVLKIARGAKGIAQNESELASYNRMKATPGGEELVAEIYNIDNTDESVRWLQSELVKELESEDDFGKAMKGYSFENFKSDLVFLTRPEQRGVFARLGNRHIKHEQFEEKLGHDLSDAAFNLLWATGSLVVSGKLVMADLAVLGHWGLTPDRRIVLLDYGYDRDVYDTHYKRRTAAELEELEAGEAKNRFSVFWRSPYGTRMTAYSNATTPEEALDVAGTAVERADLDPVAGLDGVYEVERKGDEESEVVVCDLQTPAGREAHKRILSSNRADSFLQSTR